jgi:hypothetical protein
LEVNTIANKKRRPVNHGYGQAGASHTKKGVKGFNAPSGSPRQDIDENNSTNRQRARMLYMAAPVATSAIRTNRTNVIGCGLQLKSRINREALGMSQLEAEQWQHKTESEFALWAKKKNACDATGVNDFYSMQQLALISWLISGDVFVLLKQYAPTLIAPYSLRLHIIEADRIATPDKAGVMLLSTIGKAKNGNTICDGVEINGDGMIRQSSGEKFLSEEEKKWVCPFCRSQVRKYGWGYACTENKKDSGCKFKVQKEIAGKKITDSQMQMLLASGRTGIVKGFVGKSGNPFDASLKVNIAEQKVEFDFPNRKT